MLAVEPGEAISSVPPLTVIEPLPVIGPEKVPPLVTVSAAGVRFKVPAPVSEPMLTAVLLNVAVPLSVRLGVEVIVAPEPTVRAAPLETFKLLVANAPGEASDSDPLVTL